MKFTSRKILFLISIPLYIILLVVFYLGISLILDQTAGALAIYIMQLIAYCVYAGYGLVYVIVSFLIVRKIPMQKAHKALVVTQPILLALLFIILPVFLWAIWSIIILKK